MGRPAFGEYTRRVVPAASPGITAENVTHQYEESPRKVLAFSSDNRARRTNVRGLKGIWWRLRDELKELALLLLASLPLDVGNRIRSFFLRRFLQEIGRNTIFYSGFYIANPECVSVGSNCTFARGIFITGAGGVRIGDWVGFGPDVKVWSVNHRFDDPDRPWQLQGWDKKPVVIEDDVWLAANVFVMPGVTIGKGAIVSASTVVARNVPPYAIVAGNPGRVVGWRKRPSDAPADAAPGPATVARSGPTEGPTPLRTDTSDASAAPAARLSKR